MRVDKTTLRWMVVGGLLGGLACEASDPIPCSTLEAQATGSRVACTELPFPFLVSRRNRDSTDATLVADGQNLLMLTIALAADFEVSGEKVSFKTSAGTLLGANADGVFEVFSDQNGRASALLRAPASAQLVQVTATAASRTSRAELEYLAAPVTRISLSPGTLSPGVGTELMISLSAFLDARGQLAAANERFTVETMDESAVVVGVPIEIQTDNAGQASLKMIPREPGTVLLRATSVSSPSAMTDLTLEVPSLTVARLIHAVGGSLSQGVSTPVEVFGFQDDARVQAAAENSLVRLCATPAGVLESFSEVRPLDDKGKTVFEITPTRLDPSSTQVSLRVCPAELACQDANERCSPSSEHVVRSSQANIAAMTGGISQRGPLISTQTIRLDVEASPEAGFTAGQLQGQSVQVCFEPRDGARANRTVLFLSSEGKANTDFHVGSVSSFGVAVCPTRVSCDVLAPDPSCFSLPNLEVVPAITNLAGGLSNSVLTVGTSADLEIQAFGPSAAQLTGQAVEMCFDPVDGAQAARNTLFLDNDGKASGSFVPRTSPTLGIAVCPSGLGCDVQNPPSSACFVRTDLEVAPAVQTTIGALVVVARSGIVSPNHAVTIDIFGFTDDTLTTSAGEGRPVQICVDEPARANLSTSVAFLSANGVSSVQLTGTSSVGPVRVGVCPLGGDCLAPSLAPECGSVNVTVGP